MAPFHNPDTCPNCGYRAPSLVFIVNDCEPIRRALDRMMPVWTNTSNASEFKFEATTFKLDKLLSQLQVKSYKMTDAELAAYRDWNHKPTWEGIASCRDRERQGHRFLQAQPGLQARFDRRVPRWRAGRWKSLT